MSKNLIINSISNSNNEKKYNNILFLLTETPQIKNCKIKPLNLKETQLNNNPIKIKINYPIKDLNQKYFIKKNNKKSDIDSNINIFLHKNNKYKNRITSSLTPMKNHCNFHNQFINKIYNLNNSYNEKPKVILPKIDISRNNKYSLVQTKEKSYFNRKILKEVKLTELAKNENDLDEDLISQKIKFKNNKQNKYYEAKSEWELLKDESKNSNENRLLEDLLFSDNSTKLSEVNQEVFYDDKSCGEKYKNGAQRLKEIHKQKLKDCGKLIKKFKKESKFIKKVLKDYLELMKDSFDNKEKFNNT